MIFFREYNDRIDPELPYYIWTSKDPYDTTQESFDTRKYQGQEHNYVEERPARLSKVHRSRREDASIFVAGRCLLPVKNAPALRQRLFRPESELPDVPGGMI